MGREASPMMTPAAPSFATTTIRSTVLTCPSARALSTINANDMS